MSTNPLLRLGELGQSPWYDFITRDLLASGELHRLIEEDGLKGMTTNPTIFEKAVAESSLYDEDVRRLAAARKTPAEIFEAIAVADVRQACDTFRPLYDAREGQDGLVSIEVSPALAYSTAETVAEAERLWGAVDRPNVMIKVPGTVEGLPAIESLIAQGINVNVTLLFSVARYVRVIDAYFTGLEKRAARGQPIDRISSVASFFVSRVDTKVDTRLDELGDPKGLRGKIAIANACAAYAEFERACATERWTRLKGLGAQPQRPLWASTSTKDPQYSDVHYVEPLIAPNTVNTMPPNTYDAYRDHGQPEVRIHDGISAAQDTLASLGALGIDLKQVTAELEKEGVEKFAASYDSLLASIEAKIGALGVTAAERS